MIQKTKRLLPNINDNDGYTILELMVCIAIIFILAAVALYSAMDSRKKAQDIAALAEANGFAKSVLNVLVGKEDVNFAHLPTDGTGVGDENTSGAPRSAVFTFSEGIRADVTGNTDWGGSGKTFCEAKIWHVNGYREYYLLIDEVNQISDFPDY